MNKMNRKLLIAFIVVAGLFVGVVKGQEAKSRWISKMKYKHVKSRLKTLKSPEKVILDDFEIASFHKN